MKRILVFGMTENPGGVESFLVNYYRHFDRSKLQLDFLCNSYDPVAYEDELLALGGRTFHIIARNKNPFKYRQELRSLYDTHAAEWTAVWVNVSSLANIDYLIMAKQFNIPKRIIHSHNSKNMDSRLRGLLHARNRTIVDRFATDFWACSKDAAEWFYRPDLMDRVHLISNAIDVSQMSYRGSDRDRIRQSLGIASDEVVFGNVGRLHFQKNQSFAIDVFHDFYLKHPRSKLILVGQGEDEEKLRLKCNTLGLESAVIFAGVQTDISAWLSSFDLFLFPSVFEGLGIAALEAQANGLPVLASSDVIPSDVKINPNFHFFSLQQNTASWAEKATSILSENGRLSDSEIITNFSRKGYEIHSAANILETLLLS